MTTNSDPERDRMSSKELAELIVDALVCAKLVVGERTDEAVRVVAEEIEVRKIFGGY